VESVGHFDIRSEGRNDNGATPLDPKLGEFPFLTVSFVICSLRRGDVAADDRSPVLFSC